MLDHEQLFHARRIIHVRGSATGGKLADERLDIVEKLADGGGIRFAFPNIARQENGSVPKKMATGARL